VGKDKRFVQKTMDASDEYDIEEVSDMGLRLMRLSNI